MLYGIYVNARDVQTSGRKIEVIKTVRNMNSMLVPQDGGFNPTGLKDVKDAVESESGLVATVADRDIAYALATALERFGIAVIVREYMTVASIRETLEKLLSRFDGTDNIWTGTEYLTAYQVNIALRHAIDKFSE